MESAGSSPSSTPRKRARENETASQRIKREKAAERQRRKRERDKAAGMGIVAFVPPPQLNQLQPHQGYSPSPESYISRQQLEDQLLSPEERLRRDRVRASARERQRKHRAMVKARKMHALELEMGGSVVPPSIDHVQFQPTDESYPTVLPHELQHVAQQAATGLTEPPFPQGQPHGGQTFATTLLLSFSCAPLLKQHLLRTLNMTNDELASLEPIIADAWDRWDRQRRLHYDPAQGPPNGPSPFSIGDPNGTPNASPFPGETANEFRARFHRPLLAPSPFQSANPVQVASTPPPAQDQIDPSLTAPNTSKTEPQR